jgi:hypothetical protein
MVRAMKARIAPGSIEDRILDVVPPAPATMAEMVKAGRARPEDVKAAVARLINAGVVRMLGNKRGATYVRVR